MSINSEDSNRWKRYFVGLAALNAFGIICIVLLITAYPNSPQSLPQNNTSHPGEALFKITTDKHALSEYANSYLRQIGKGKIDYRVHLNDSVVLDGKLTMLGRRLIFRMSFQPLVQPNGDLILKQEAIVLGRLELPVRNVLELIRTSYKFPDWVTVMPKDEQIYVAVTGIELKNKSVVEVSSFNLQQDLIEFHVYLKP